MIGSGLMIEEEYGLSAHSDKEKMQAPAVARESYRLGAAFGGEFTTCRYAPKLSHRTEGRLVKLAAVCQLH